MSLPKVFVSFSSLDRDLVRPLLARLEAQPISVWNYSDEMQEIPGGAAIPAYLQEKIEKSDYFLPLITDHSLASVYTRLETQHALQTAGLRVIPIVPSTAPSPSTWIKPYSDLTVLRYRSGEISSRMGLEAIIQAICKDMGVSFFPLPYMDPRLPFMDRFESEIRERCPRRSDHENAIYSRLQLILSDFQDLYENGHLRDALSRIGLFIALCEYEYPDVRFYYPYLVLAVCQISCGQINQASETLNSLRSHPSLDENVFGALAYISQHQGRHRDALDHYREASRRDPQDAAATAGILLNALLCRETVDFHELLKSLDSAKVLVEEDRRKIMALRAFAFASLGMTREAESAFNALLSNGESNSDVIVNYADLLHSIGHVERALQLLREKGISSESEQVLHRVATWSFQSGDQTTALKYIQELIQKHPESRQYRFEAAVILIRSRHRKEALEVAKVLLSHESFSAPRTADDFYYDGLANWLLNRRERAEYDFERSGRPEEEHYRHLD